MVQAVLIAILAAKLAPDLIVISASLAKIHIIILLRLNLVLKIAQSTLNKILLQTFVTRCQPALRENS
jgi:hypothetical protein